MRHHSDRLPRLGTASILTVTLGALITLWPAEPGVAHASPHSASNEQGPAAGTVKGTIYVHLKIVSTTHVTAEVSIYPSGGSITGFGTASYHRGTSSADFSGSLSINRGTGSYSHAHGSGLSFSGTIQRSNDAVTVRVSGKVSA